MAAALEKPQATDMQVDGPPAVDAMLLEDPVVRLSDLFLATMQPVVPPSASTHDATSVEAAGYADEHAPCDAHARYPEAHARPPPTPSSLLAEHCHATRAGLS